jgi:hypothetical protein
MRASSPLTKPSRRRIGREANLFEMTPGPIGELPERLTIEAGFASDDAVGGEIFESTADRVGWVASVVGNLPSRRTNPLAWFFDAGARLRRALAAVGFESETP